MVGGWTLECSVTYINYGYVYIFIYSYLYIQTNTFTSVCRGKEMKKKKKNLKIIQYSKVKIPVMYSIYSQAFHTHFLKFYKEEIINLLVGGKQTYNNLKLHTFMRNLQYRNI